MRFTSGRLASCLPLAGLLLAFCSTLPAYAQPASKSSPSDTVSAQPLIAPAESVHEEAAAQLRAEEKQRLMKVIPDFNTTNNPDAAPLSAGQKFQLAFRGAIDPFQFAVAGIDAGFSQARNGFAGYSQGMSGYGMRFGASYADSFDNAMIGNALLPALLHEDPRYFRRGTGSFTSRFFYALSTSVRCRNDKGKWVPDYSDILGELASGGLSNLYYPRADRGVGLTFQRAMTQVAEGAVGAVFFEFWPDIARKNPFRKPTPSETLK